MREVTTDYWFESSKSNNPPTDAQFASGGCTEDLPEALKWAKEQAEQLKCHRRPDRENDRVLFYADRHVSRPPPSEHHCSCCKHKPPKYVRYRPQRRPMPGMPIGDHYVVRVMKRESI